MMNEALIIRNFLKHEWEILRAKRLEAVSAHANFFLGNYESESALDQAHWENTIISETCSVFGLWDDATLIGISGVFKNRHDVSGKSALLGMSYLDPAYRGRGLSRLFYEARIAWAREKGYERIIVSHRDGNEASRRANAAFGFVHYESEMVTYGDGKEALDHRYELKLK